MIGTQPPLHARELSFRCGFLQGEGGLDEGGVREGLREVAKVPAGFRVHLLGVESDGVGQCQQFLEELDGLAAAVEEGRVDPEDIVRGLGDVARALEDQPDAKYPATAFRPRRLAASLDDIGSRSARLRSAAFRIGVGAAGLMLTIERPVRTPVGQLTPLLRVLVELRAQGADDPIEPGALHSLARLGHGSGEAARLARSLVGAA